MRYRKKTATPQERPPIRGFAIGMHKWRIGMKKLITKSVE